MSPEFVPIIEKLAEQGVTAAMLFAAVYYLSRTLKVQYEARIISLEERSAACEAHRLELGREIRTMQNERINLLERKLEEKVGE
jgi:hypothetical protein